MLYALTIFVSAFLLFLVQPLIAKQILPWFGGTAAVWTVCLLFFQLVLLAGYVYADRLSRLAMRRQAMVHTVLVVLACATLPILADPAWKPTGAADPTWRILLLLAATIGLPYLAVSSTGPLVQSWFARTTADPARQAKVYRLFALSNFASLVALVAYPFLFEPNLSLRVQGWSWSAGFVLFSGLVVASAWRTESRARAMTTAPAHEPAAVAIGDAPAQTEAAIAPAAAAPGWRQYALWLALSALGTVMLLSITTHVTQDVASVPFLWIVPLSLYLLTFILCFDSDFWYRRWLFWPAVIVVVPFMAWGLSASNGVLDIHRALPLYAGGLFVVCMFCHGELVRARPAPAWLTRFYLMVSAGGALGGLLVALAAPRLFGGPWELPLALMASALLLAVVARDGLPLLLLGLVAALLAGLAWLARTKWLLPLPSVLVLLGTVGLVLAAVTVWRRHSMRAGAALLAAASAAGCVWLGTVYLDYFRLRLETSSRNFYGTLRVTEYGDREAQTLFRVLLHGVISHGEQSFDPEQRRKPTSYYGPSSGAGLAIAKVNSKPQRIGVIGLGVGTIAAYGQPGSTIRYYEINPAVVEIAKTQFTYLADSAAQVDIVLGDARLSMEHEAAAGQKQRFDVLVVDAFSSDSIPVHLMTREALQVYLQHIQPQGVIAFHVSNRYLNLAPVVTQLAQDAGLQSIYITDVPDRAATHLSSTSYVLVTRNQAFLDDAEVQASAVPVTPIEGLRPWTDDYNNLLKILR